jgi:hypothetical protein
MYRVHAIQLGQGRLSISSPFFMSQNNIVYTYTRESNNVRSCVARVLFGHVPKPPRVWKATRDDALG